MKLRKANAIFSLLTTIFLYGHAISLAIWMLSSGSTSRAPAVISQIMTVCFVIHAGICMYQMVTSHKGVPKTKSKQYPKLNAQTMVQRISGVFLIVFTWLHIAGTLGIMTPPQVVHAIVPPLFFALVMAHIAVSASKAFITLGIGNAKFVKRADKAIKVICAVTLIADVTGFYLYVC